MNPKIPNTEINNDLIGSLTLKNKKLESENAQLLLIEEKAVKLKHLYAFISQVNQNIVRVQDQTILFRNACKMAIEFGKFKMAWIGLFNQSNKTIELVDQKGIPEKNLHLFSHPVFQENGPQDWVIKKETYYICNDIPNSLELENWKPFAANNGIHSCMILPIRKSGIIIGTLNLYSSERNFSSKEEIALLVEVAKDISYALDKFEKEAKYKAIEEQLVINEKLFRSLIEKGADMITLKDIEGNIIYGSPSIKTILGLSNEELLSRNSSHFIHKEDLAGLDEQIKMISKIQGASFFRQQRYLHKNGNWIWCEGTVTNMLGVSGVNALVSNFKDISEHKAAETQKEFDKNNLKALINNTHDLLWSVDKEFNLITSNIPFAETFRNISGKNIKKGDNVLSLGFTQDQIHRFRTYYNRAFNGETFTVLEYIQHPEEIWSEISFRPIVIENGIFGTACQSHDITKRIKSEQHLKRSEQFNRGILNSLSASIAVVDYFGNIIAVNQTWEQFAIENGATPLTRSGVGSNYFDVCRNAISNFEPFAEKAMQGILDVLNDRKVIFNLEYPCHSPTEQRWFGMRVMKFASEKPLVVISHENITERITAVKELKKSVTGLREAQRIAKIGNWQIDLRTNTHHWSDELFELFGINKNEGKESTELYLSFIHPEDLNYVKNNIIESNKYTTSTSTEFRYQTKTGKTRFGYAERKFEFDVEGNPIRIYGILQDITERKTNELKLAEQNEQLIKTNFELDRFVYSVSHDLRAPLASTLGLLHFIDLETNEESTLKYTSMIHTSITRMEEFIKNILNYSHGNRAEINIEHIPVQESINEIINSLRNTKDASKIDINIDVTTEVEFYSDIFEFRIVLENIISNAIKYQNQSRSDQRIQITGKSDLNALQLTITDNGIGIPIEYHQKIFDMFFRLPSKKAGSGIGLYVVKGIIDKLQGSIELHSEVGKGTQFIITLKNFSRPQDS